MSQKIKKNKIDRYIDSLHDIKGKTVIVTGANSGLGYEISRVALLKGAHLVMACRNLDRANSAKAKLIKDTGRDDIVIEQYDQSKVTSIHAFSKTILEKYSDFYSLVLNAGIYLRYPEVDEFHISRVYRNNFIGANILLKDLEKFLNNVDEEKRIIIQGSMASFAYKYKNKDKFIYGEDKAMKQYCLSKLCCSNLYVYYRDRNTNAHVKYLLCEPGIATTNLFNGFEKWFKNLALLFMKIFTNSAREGALSACKLMCDVAANGDYYKPRHFFTSKGLPKKRVFPKEYIFPNIMGDAEEVVKVYENAK